ncbi:MAG: phosphoribosyl-ATP diphosphatase [Acidimicrobiia bacterium]
MIIPSIDISGGQAVQLVGGEVLAIEAGDPLPIMERFSVVGEVAVIDIDAARGEGHNRELITELCRRGRVRVGGGIRHLDAARRWLDLGAAKIIIGTAATPEFLSSLPRDRVMVALDSRDGDVLSHGWRQSTGQGLLNRIAELRDLCDSFQVTFVEREGQLRGTDLDLAQQVIAAAGEARVTIAGGINTAEQIAALDRLGADAQVGMALYTGAISLADAVTAPLVSDRVHGLWPTVVVDETGVALGLVWSSRESVRRAVEIRRGVYQSRSRGMWVKGETSGAVQELLGVEADCDRDTLRFTVRQHGPGFCHTGDRTCWGQDHGLGRLQRRILIPKKDPGSNTQKLLDDPILLGAKIREEAEELAKTGDRDRVVAEAADLLYFLLVKTAALGVSLDEVENELDRRERRVTRRPMTAKESR